MNFSENAISIVPVQNGFIVYLPAPITDPNKQFIDGLVSGLPQVMEAMQKDPTLSRIESEMNNEAKSYSTPQLLKDPCTFIFESFEQVLAFLANQFLKNN